MPNTYTYQKKDKLKSRKQTQFLFAKGHAITNFPIRLIYTIQEKEQSDFGLLKAGVGAPSRIFRKAVERNRIKRLLREGYRLERPAFEKLILIKNKQVNLFFLYIDVNLLTQKEIQAKIQVLLAKLVAKINTYNSLNDANA